MTERAAGQVVPLGRGCTIAYAEPAIERLPVNMVEAKPTVMVAVPRLYERLYARVVSTVEAGPGLRKRIFWWAAGLGRQHYQNHLEGKADSAWLGLQMRLADRLVFSKIRARTGGRVRYFVSGGAPLSREIGEFFYAMGMLILEGYGLTETAPLLTINRPGDFKFGTVGKPVAETQIKIDPGTGEILARGPQIMVGYHNQAEETAQVIDADGWFHTGDIGELDEIGRVIITDRLKNIIVLANGKNVAPAPMEIALATSKYIAQAVILGDQQPYTGVLIAPDFEELGAWAAANGLAEAPPEQLVADDRRGEALPHRGAIEAGGLRGMGAAAPDRPAAAPADRGGGGADPVTQGEAAGRQGEVGGQARVPLRRGEGLSLPDPRGRRLNAEPTATCRGFARRCLSERDRP